MNCKQTLIFLLMFLSLCACTQNHSVNYFLKHPDEIKNRLDQCEPKNQSNITCQSATQAARLLNQYLPIMEQNPERMGEEILKTETACYTDLPESKDAQAKNCERVKYLLAIISLTNPGN